MSSTSIYQRPFNGRGSPDSKGKRNTPTVDHLQTNYNNDGPAIFGIQLKYISLVTLAVQNAALSIVMHYSRVSTPPSQSYSPASAVLLNELLKGTISFVVAVQRVFNTPDSLSRKSYLHSIQQVCREVFSLDCWKLSIPAILYVIQNSLQFVAISNLPVATFQVTYQMKILTTAAFSVMMLRKSISSTKWTALFFLAFGVAIVQLQTTSAISPPTQIDIPVGSAHDAAPVHIHIMSPLKGFGAVIAACFTSGLAGVYFEKVLKGSKADLWVRNVQLSLFSLIPALLPVVFSLQNDSRGFVRSLLNNFGGWAWATVGIQVFGGLVTAVVIKYSDNILKGFATSLAIVLSFLASVVLFDFRLTPSFVVGSSTVLVATWMYNQPEGKEIISVGSVKSSKSVSFLGSPIGSDSPIIGQPPSKKSSPFGSPRLIANALGLTSAETGRLDVETRGSIRPFDDTQHTSRYLNAPYGSPWPSRSPSPATTQFPSHASNQPPPYHSIYGSERRL